MDKTCLKHLTQLNNRKHLRYRIIIKLYHSRPPEERQEQTIFKSTKNLPFAYNRHLQNCSSKNNGDDDDDEMTVSMTMITSFFKCPCFKGYIVHSGHRKWLKQIPRTRAGCKACRLPTGNGVNRELARRSASYRQKENNARFNAKCLFLPSLFRSSGWRNIHLKDYPCSKLSRCNSWLKPCLITRGEC